MLTLPEIFNDAADLLETRGWCQGEGEDDEGRLCVTYALSIASHSQFSWYKAAFARWLVGVDDRYLCLTLPNFSLPQWNDSPERTKEEVIQKLREYAKVVK